MGIKKFLWSLVGLSGFLVCFLVAFYESRKKFSKEALKVFFETVSCNKGCWITHVGLEKISEKGLAIPPSSLEDGYLIVTRDGHIMKRKIVCFQ